MSEESKHPEVVAAAGRAVAALEVVVGFLREQGCTIGDAVVEGRCNVIADLAEREAKQLIAALDRHMSRPYIGECNG